MWKDRKWEWATLRPENGTFDMPATRTSRRASKWFYQAMVESPAMFRRTAGAGSLYWLGLRDGTGAFLDGAKTYKLTVPLPVPAKLFWSVTVYDPETRSEIQTKQGKAALRSLVELKDGTGANRSISISARRRPTVRGPVDSDHSRQGLVHLLPHLRAGEAGLRRQLEAR